MICVQRLGQHTITRQLKTDFSFSNIGRSTARSRLVGERPRGTRLEDVWEGAGSGKRTQGDLLRERRVVREMGAGARGV